MKPFKATGAKSNPLFLVERKCEAQSRASVVFVYTWHGFFMTVGFCSNDMGGLVCLFTYPAKY